MDYIDLHFGGHARVIATAVLRGADGVTLVDPGPTSCLPALERGLAGLGASLSDVRRILLTHIHLDHAGATGTILARVPAAEVLVHERGAPHMIHPAKLIASATRLYGDRMDALWGRFDAAPAERVRVLQGGERLDVAGRPIRVAYTPGHAVHHVSYLDESDGTAYVGDTCGIRVAGDYIVAATPPPDIDIELWNRSLDAIEAWQATSLFLTHFGPVGAARAHRKLSPGPGGDGEAVSGSLAGGDSDEQRAAQFAADMRRAARQALSETDAAALEQAAPFEQIWAGLARYWRKRRPSDAGG
ncbi:MAG: MBL fold metallo-hydrolase [Vicinamibacterales bacterium]